jgi:hypothetical protein
MKALKYLSFVGKVAGFVSAIGVIPFVDPKVGVIVFAAEVAICPILSSTIRVG